MKISKEMLKEIIKEELELQDFGKSSVSKTDRTKDLKAKAIDSDSQKQIDNLERGIIKQFTDRLQKLAELSNIKSGSVNSLLKRVYAIMDKEIQKLESGEQQDEK
jgi:hypothetical protein